MTTPRCDWRIPDHERNHGGRAEGQCRNAALPGSERCGTHTAITSPPLHVPTDGVMCADVGCEPCMDLRWPPGTWPNMPTAGSAR